MQTHDWLTQQFEDHRSHLRAVAYRMLGSHSEADDVVQDAWLRLARADTSTVENLGGWLTTVVARASLDLLRSRKSRREESMEAHPVDAIADPSPASAPEHDVLMADAVGPALLVLLETLAPAERVAFVLHDVFDLPFDEIAPIVGRTPTATRQLASRARRRVQGAPAAASADLSRRRTVVDAFLTASRSGDFTALISLLDPDVVLHADHAAVLSSAANLARGALPLAPEIRGAQAVAETFKGRAKAAQTALVDGVVGAVWAPGGQTRVVFAFTIRDERIVGIEIVADPEQIGELDVEILED